MEGAWGRNIMSATNRGSLRVANDFYPTPVECVEALLLQLNLRDDLSYLEPCRGSAEGSIYSRLPKGTLWAELSEGVDYCTVNRYEADVCITNPPFSRALTFLQKSLKECGTVVYLLRLNFLGSQSRKAFWEQNPPSHLYVLSKRPSFTGRGTDATEYAWFVWDRKGICKKPPGIYVL